MKSSETESTQTIPQLTTYDSFKYLEIKSTLQDCQERHIKIYLDIATQGAMILISRPLNRYHAKIYLFTHIKLKLLPHTP